MSDWSSFKDAKKQSDAWKSFLNESVEPKEATEIPLDEFFFGAKAKSGGKYGLSYDDNEYIKDMRPGAEADQKLPPEEYNADDVTALYKALDDINKALNLQIDRQALFAELEALLTDPKGNNYTIKEAIHKAAVILSRMPVLGPDNVPDANKYPNLTKLFQGAVTNDKTREHLHKILARAGFFGQQGDLVPDWIKKTVAAPQQQGGDIDKDGVPDAQDKDADGDGTPNAQDQDADGDGSPDDKQKAAQGEKIVVMWPRVHARAQEIMGMDRWDKNKVQLVLQAFSRLNKNANIEFTPNAQIGEDMDVAAAARLLRKSKAAEGIDAKYIRDVMQAIMDVSGVTLKDFNSQGNAIPEPGAAKDKQEPKAAQAPAATPVDAEEEPDEEESPATQDTDNDGTPDAQDQDDDGDGVPDEQDQDDDGDGVPDAQDQDDQAQADQEPEQPEEEPEDAQEYEVATLAAFPRLKNAWRESNPPPGATWPADMAAFINFIGPYALKAKQSGVLNDPTVNENVIQQLVGRPGGEDGEPWRQSPFLRIGNRGAIGKEMAMKLNRLPKNKSGNGKRDRIERVLNVVLGPGGKAPSHKMIRDEFVNLLGMIKPAEQKEAPKDEPKQKAAAAQEPTRRTGTAALARGADRRAKLQQTMKGLGRGGIKFEEGTDTLNESKTIDRWKTLAGIK